MIRACTVFAALAVSGAAFAGAAVNCPSTVTAAVVAAHAGASVTSCRPTPGAAEDAFEVKSTLPDGRLVTCTVERSGKIVATSEQIALAELPPAVSKAFADAYPSVRPSGADRRTGADGAITYAVAYRSEGRLERAIFDPAGARVGARDAASDCPKPRADCVCTANYAPVVCDGRCTYSNACFASCAGARGCVRTPD
jgi:hypothetical protein